MRYWYLAIIACLSLVGCKHHDAKPQVYHYPKFDFEDALPFYLDVKDVLFINAYASHKKEHVPEIVDILERWFNANIYAGGQQGKAIVTLRDANVEQLESGLRVSVILSLDVLNPPSFGKGQAVTQFERVFVLKKARLSPGYDEWKSFIEQFLEGLRSQFKFNVNAYMPNLILPKNNHQNGRGT